MIPPAHQKIKYMKRSTLTGSAAALLAAFALATSASAQTSTTTVDSLNSAGTISEMGPDMITIRSTAAAEPVRYTASKTTTYVDDTGAPVSMEVVKSGAPVTVYYTQSGGNMVASRVVVSRTTTTTAPVAVPVAPAAVEEKSTTTTTTTDQ